MKYSLNWLKELAPFTWSLDDMVNRLTMAGVEVEHVIQQGAGLDQVVVARVLKSEQHPNADRLSVCEVDTGKGVSQIVCGAKNYKVGDLIPLALPGAKLPDGMEIRKSKLRGVASEGMMCSARELGLAEDAEGLMILPTDLKEGTPIKEALGLNDIILDLEITPNRPDLLSHWGLAREIAALGGLEALDCRKLLSREDETHLSQGGDPAGISVSVEDATLCPRYTARIIRGVKVGESPSWLKQRLAALGHRSISNVVDVTNYVLEEIGQPLHAFDLRLLKGSAIVVRRARAGENIMRLDDETSRLEDSMLVIADAERPVAIAGVMGGKETGVSPETVDILLESATFQPSSVRKTSKRLAVSSDSSYRFERGVDPSLAYWASLRATQLLLQIAGGKADGKLIDISTDLPKPQPISCRHQRVARVMGVTLPSSETDAMLTRLGCKVVAGSESSEVVPPTYRPDLIREVDLIEEIVRVYGIDRIPGRTGAHSPSTTRDDAGDLFLQRLRGQLSALGLDEAVHYTLVSNQQITLSHPDSTARSLLLANPLNSEMDALRPSLIHGMLESVSRNLSGGVEGVSHFELGTVFHPTQEGVGERVSLGIILAGQSRDGATWEKGVKGRPYDFYDLKGKLDSLFQSLKLPEIVREKMSSEEYPLLESGSGVVFKHEGKTLGFAAKVNTARLQNVKITPEVYFAEWDVEALRLLTGGIVRYRPWTSYPPILRDIAMTVDAKEKHEKIEQIFVKLARQYAAPKGIILQKVEIFDIFESEKVGAGKKSLAYSLTYRSLEKTLTIQEVNLVHEAIKKQLKQEMACELRE